MVPNASMPGHFIKDLEGTTYSSLDHTTHPILHGKEQITKQHIVEKLELRCRCKKPSTPVSRRESWPWESRPIRCRGVYCYTGMEMDCRLICGKFEGVSETEQGRVAWQDLNGATRNGRPKKAG